MRNGGFRRVRRRKRGRRRRRQTPISPVSNGGGNGNIFPNIQFDSLSRIGMEDSDDEQQQQQQQQQHQGGGPPRDIFEDDGEQQISRFFQDIPNTVLNGGQAPTQDGDAGEEEVLVLPDSLSDDEDDEEECRICTNKIPLSRDIHERTTKMFDNENTYMSMKKIGTISGEAAKCINEFVIKPYNEQQSCRHNHMRKVTRKGMKRHYKICLSTAKKRCWNYVKLVERCIDGMAKYNLVKRTNKGEVDETTGRRKMVRYYNEPTVKLITALTKEYISMNIRLSRFERKSQKKGNVGGGGGISRYY